MDNVIGLGVSVQFVLKVSILIRYYHLVAQQSLPPLKTELVANLTAQAIGLGRALSTCPSARLLYCRP